MRFMQFSMLRLAKRISVLLTTFLSEPPNILGVFVAAIIKPGRSNRPF